MQQTKGPSFYQRRNDLCVFYNQCWRSIADVFEGLATSAGTVDFRRREMGTWWLQPNGKRFMTRSRMYSNANALIQDVANSEDIAIAVQLGGVFPNKGMFKQQRSENTDGKFEAWHYIIIDIDLNDSYRRQHVCACKGKEVCDICWSVWITPARKVLTWILTDIFQFECVFDCFSGRRGIHFWILDNRVQEWTNEQRHAFAARLVSLGKPDEIQDPAILTTLYGMLEPVFDKYFWDNPNFEYVKDKDKCNNEYEKHRYKIQECFKMLYPEIDTPVITHRDHLVKLPLSPHDETGLLAMPLPPPFNAKHPFKLSRDCIHYSKVTPKIIQQLAFPIRRALDALSRQ